MRDYSIGEVSRIVKMPVQTIRFLEEKGLISPTRRPDNNYRIYQDAEINRLLNYRWYRDIGCSAKESIELVKDSDLFQFGSRVTRIQHRIERQAYLYEQLALRLKSYCTLLNPETLANTINVCTPAKSPDMFCSFYARLLDESVSYLPADQREGRFDDRSYLPFTDIIFCIPKEKLLNENDNPKTMWGFGIGKEWNEALGPDSLENVRHIPSANTIHTVLRVGSRQTVEERIRSVVFPYAEQEGYTMSDDVWGTLIVELREGDDIVQYLEAWAPIAEN